MNLPPRKFFGRNVYRLRMQRKLTQEQLAERAGIERREVQRIESGEVDPSFEAHAGELRRRGRAWLRLSQRDHKVSCAAGAAIVFHAEDSVSHGPPKRSLLTMG